MGESQLYRGRPGFAYPYEGPTTPESEKPEGWEEMSLDERLEYTLKAFEDKDAEADPGEGE